MADAPNTVPLVDQTGTIQEVDPSEVAGLVSGGFQQPTAEQLDAHAKSQLNDTLPEQLKGAAEGAASALSLGTSTLAEKKLFNVKDEDINRRRDTLGHTLGTVGSLIGVNLIPGLGEAADTYEAGSAAASAGSLAQAANIAKTGGAGVMAAGGAEAGALAGRAANALGAGVGLEGAAANIANQAAQMAILQAGDENSKWLSNNPGETLTNALGNIGMASLVGGGFGAAGSALGAVVGTPVGRVVSDMRGRLRELASGADPVQGITQELMDADQVVQGAELHGEGGLKDQLINKLGAEVNPADASEHAKGVLEMVDANIAKAQAKPGIYQGGRVAALQEYRNELANELQKSAGPADTFKALNNFKKSVGSLKDWSKFEPATEKPGAQMLTDVYQGVRKGLEDTETWGKLGKAQQVTNQATTDLISAEKQLNKFKAIGADGQRMLDPNKIATYVKQAGKGTAEIKQGVVRSYIDAVNNYVDTIGKVHEQLGVESPITPPAFQSLEATLGTKTTGAKVADALYSAGVNKLAGRGIGAAVGAALGKLVNAPGMGALVGEHTLGPFLDSVMPSIIKPMLNAVASGPGFADSTRLGLAALKGKSILSRAADAAIKGTSSSVLDSLTPSASSLGKLQKWADAASNDQSKLLDASGSVGHYMPGHAAALGAKVATVWKYLDDAKPKLQQKNIFDAAIKPTNAQMAAYERTREIAEQPLIAIKRVKDGTLTPKDVRDLASMHPDALSSIGQALTNSVIAHQAKGGSVPLKVQQSLSMLIGQPLSSNFAPQSIQAVQSVFQEPGQPPGQQGGAPTRNKSKTSSLDKLSSQYRTPGQAREQDRQSKE